MTKHMKQFVVMLLGFSIGDLFAVGREDGIKFGSVRRGKERLDWLKATYSRFREWAIDKAILWDHRLTVAMGCLAFNAVQTARDLLVALQSHPDDNTDRPAGWRRVQTRVPKTEQAAAHALAVAKPKRGKEKKVPSDRTLKAKSHGDLILLAEACGLKDVFPTSDMTEEQLDAHQASLLKRLKAKRCRQKKANEDAVSTGAPANWREPIDRTEEAKVPVVTVPQCGEPGTLPATDA